jgi:tetraacyldisaccharide 4'-kinase
MPPSVGPPTDPPANPPDARLAQRLARHAWQPQPTWLARLLAPLAWLHALLAALHRTWGRLRGPAQLPVPVLVVGNMVVGGTGKTPVVIAAVQALQAAGRRPGVISRGHGRRSEGGTDLREVSPASRADQAGDEPLLVRRRTGVPVWVGRDRVAAARALCAAHPEVDVLVSDDGLQHHALPRQVEWIVFDARGVGNGLRLPAGPLREALPARPGPAMRVLYNAAQPSTPLPGTLLAPRMERALDLAQWWGDTSTAAAAAAVPLAALRGRRMLAVAGIGDPERFFARLEQAGLDIERSPQPDHAPYGTLPWAPGTVEVVTTEKDAVKLDPRRLGATRVWVVPLDLALPADLVRDLLQRLAGAHSA